MSHVKSFEVNGATYNVARSSAVEQDEVLSLLTTSLMQILTRSALAGGEDKGEEEVVFGMVLSMPIEWKRKVDALLMKRIKCDGVTVDAKHFDGRVMDYNRLRAQVLMWNLEGFFTYWASVKQDVIEAINHPQEQAT